MIALLNQIPSEVQIKKTLRKSSLAPKLYPRCPQRDIYRSEDRYRCRRCRLPFSLLSGTWLKGLKLNLRTFYALLWCWTQKIPVLQTQKLCHVGEETVSYWFREFRFHLPDLQPILAGKVQMDEAYFHSLSLLLAKQVGTKETSSPDYF